MESRRNGPQLSSRHDDDDDGRTGDDGLELTWLLTVSCICQLEDMHR